jgi:ADP-L-glycero-D-manno-heptose 6-epimerase
MKEKNRDQYIVITGAAGMIGSCVVRHLNDCGYNNLILVDNLDGLEKWKNLLGKKFLQLIPIEGLFPFLQGREQEIFAFIHLGACSDTLEKNGDYLMSNNYTYSIKLAEYALSHKHKFIYASSAATYGDGSLGFSDDPAMLESLQPLNLYGFSKYLFDLWVVRQGLLQDVVGLKYFNVFGPNENHKGHMASMVHKMYPAVKSQGVLQLFQSLDPLHHKDGESARDFIYVKDAARITCEFLTSSITGIFNVGSGIPTTWNALAKAVFTAVGLAPNIQYIPMPQELRKQYQSFTCADMHRLEQIRTAKGLGPLCTFSVEEAVMDYVTDHLAKDKRW